MELGAWSLSLPTVPAGIPQLEACRLKLGAFFSQLSTLRNILDGGKYGSYLIYSFINFFLFSVYHKIHF